MYPELAGHLQSRARRTVGYTCTVLLLKTTRRYEARAGDRPGQATRALPPSAASVELSLFLLLGRHGQRRIYKCGCPVQLQYDMDRDLILVSYTSRCCLSAAVAMDSDGEKCLEHTKKTEKLLSECDVP